MREINSRGIFFGPAFFAWAFFVFVGLAPGFVLAAGSATVSWTPPATDEGGGALTGLAGYKVYYDTTSHWTSSCPVAGTTVDVPGGATTSYRFNNTLTPGEHYYFTVVAYDDADPANISGCASDGTDTEVDKVVSYSGDIDAVADHDVDIDDFTLFATDYGRTSFCGPVNKADINGDCTVDINDFTILAEDYGLSF